MHSSAVVAFRALFMIACMIAIPSVALFWKSWPEILESIVSGRLPKLVADSGGPPSHRYDQPRGGEAPPFAPYDEAPPFQPTPQAETNPWPAAAAPQPYQGVETAHAPSAHPSWTPPEHALPQVANGSVPPPSPYASPTPQVPSEVAPWQQSVRPDQSGSDRYAGVAPGYAPPVREWAAEAVDLYASEPSARDYAAGTRYDDQVAPAAYHHPAPQGTSPYAPPRPDYATRGQEPAPGMPPAAPIGSNAPSWPSDGGIAPAFHANPASREPERFAEPGRLPHVPPAASDEEANPWKPSAAPAHSAPFAAPAADRFAAMERRLRELGASYYLLETWGQQGELYRFHAKMSLSGNPRYNRHFEATDSDAMAAMQQVLDQVEAWRAGRAY